MSELNDVHTIPCPQCGHLISARVEPVVCPDKADMLAANAHAYERELVDPMNRIHPAPFTLR